MICFHVAKVALDAGLWQVRTVITHPPVCLSIAGSDSSAGAGVQADLKTFAALGTYGVNAVTAIVAEAPGQVSHIEACDPTGLGTQLNRVRSAFPIAAAKTGMLAIRENVELVVEFFRENSEIPLVVDPVFRATAGDFPLLEKDGIDVLKKELLPQATLITPNRMEAETLLGKEISTLSDFESAPRGIFDSFGCAVLLKGGHFLQSGSEILTDIAWTGSGELLRFDHARLDVPDLHGTGCTLSAAITAHLAKGKNLEQAIALAIEYLELAMGNFFQWSNEKTGGVAALNHFVNDTTVPES